MYEVQILPHLVTQFLWVKAVFTLLVHSNVVYQEGPAQHVPAVSTETVEGARQPCSDWLDARHLAIVLIHPSRQGFSS